jgi:hypothetical protein
VCDQIMYVQYNTDSGRKLSRYNCFDVIEYAHISAVA